VRAQARISARFGGGADSAEILMAGFARRADVGLHAGELFALLRRGGECLIQHCAQLAGVFDKAALAAEVIERRFQFIAQMAQHFKVDERIGGSAAVCPGKLLQLRGMRLEQVHGGERIAILPCLSGCNRAPAHHHGNRAEHQTQQKAET